MHHCIAFSFSLESYFGRVLKLVDQGWLPYFYTSRGINPDPGSKKSLGNEKKEKDFILEFLI